MRVFDISEAEPSQEGEEVRKEPPVYRPTVCKIENRGELELRNARAVEMLLCLGAQTGAIRPDFAQR